MSTNLPGTQLGAELMDTREKLGGKFPGYRRAFARGYCYDATFTPTGNAAEFTTAGHLQNDPVRATVRFGDVSGNPYLSDARTAVRGLSVKFHLADDSTDLLAVNFERFSAPTPEGFLEQMTAFTPDPATGRPNPETVEAYVKECPISGQIVAAAGQVPTPASFGTATYWAINTFIWKGANQVARPVKYHWEPEAGNQSIPEEEVKTKSAEYLAEELQDRLADGPVNFTLKVRFGAPEDSTDDPTQVWPSNRPEINAGQLRITNIADNQHFWNSQSFDPNNLTDGIYPSDDPVLKIRSFVYAISYDRRNQAM